MSWGFYLPTEVYFDLALWNWQTIAKVHNIPGGFHVQNFGPCFSFLTWIVKKFTTCSPKSLDNIVHVFSELNHVTTLRNSRNDMLCSGKVLFARHLNKSTYTWSWLCSDRYCITIGSKPASTQRCFKVDFRLRRWTTNFQRWNHVI